jgi:hypothetical protein
MRGRCEASRRARISPEAGDKITCATTAAGDKITCPTATSFCERQMHGAGAWRSGKIYRIACDLRCVAVADCD